MGKLLLRFWYFLIGKGNDAMDSIEDEVSMAKTGLREWETYQVEAKEAQVTIEAQRIETNGLLNKSRLTSTDLEQKATQLLVSASEGKIEEDVAEEAAQGLLDEKENVDNEVATYEAQLEVIEDQASQMKDRVKEIKDTVNKYKSDIRSIESGSKVVKATEKINKVKAGIGSGPGDYVEKAKEKLAQKQATAQAYGVVADDNKSATEKATDLLKKAGKSQSLADLKAKMKAKTEA